MSVFMISHSVLYGPCSLSGVAFLFRCLTAVSQLKIFMVRVDLQPHDPKYHGFQLLCPALGADVDGTKAGNADDGADLAFGFLRITSDEDIQWLAGCSAAKDALSKFFGDGITARAGEVVDMRQVLLGLRHQHLPIDRCMALTVLPTTSRG